MNIASEEAAVVAKSGTGGHKKNWRGNRNLQVFRDRLAEAMEEKGTTNTDFAKFLDCNYRSIYNWLNGPNHPDLQTIRDMARYLNVSLDWLFGLNENKSRIPGKIKQSLDSYIQIPEYDVDVAAGDGAVPLSEAVVDHVLMKRDWAEEFGTSLDNLGIIRIKGDSMSPTLHNGDKAIVNFSQNRPKDGQVFILGIGDEVVAKRLFVDPVGRGVMVHSDNKNFKEFGPVKSNDLRVIGEIVGAITPIQ